MALVHLRDLDSRFMADVWCEGLERAGIPYLLRSNQDTAYGNIFVTQKGFASLLVENEWLEKAAQVDKDLEASISPVPFDAASLAAKLECNLLDPTAGAEKLQGFIEKCLEMGCAAACISPWLVKKAAPLLAGSPVALCSPVGFPLGFETTKSKCDSARELISAGARELELVLNRGLAANGGLETAIDEVKAVADAAAGAPLKVILEMGQLGEKLSQEAAQALVESQAVSYLKTHSGFFGQAGLEDVALLNETVGGSLGIKAEGGVKGVKSLMQFCRAGAGRIGSDHAYQIWQEAKRRWPNQD